VDSQSTPGLTPFEQPTATQILRGWATPPPHDSRRTPVLFIHPINLQGLAWGSVAAALSADRRCLLPDLRGHGRSTARSPFGVDAWVDDLVAVLDHFDVARCHAVGGSLGGALAVALAACAPERVVSIGAFGSTLNVAGEGLATVLSVLREKGVRATFEQTIPEVSVAPKTPEQTVATIIGLTNPNDVPVVSEIWQTVLGTDIADRADSVEIPVLVVTGEFDRTCPPEQGKAMADRLGARFVSMPGVGHLPMLEAPGPTAALLRDFLDAQEAPG
jgi:pimeloyl-ACP methyl ester carboxylesterase